MTNDKQVLGTCDKKLNGVQISIEGERVFARCDCGWVASEIRTKSLTGENYIQGLAANHTPCNLANPLPAVTEPASVSLEEICECGHTAGWHSLTSDGWMPSASGCFSSGCRCRKFHAKLPKLPKPQPAQAESAKVEKIFCRCGAEIENVGGPYWISVGITTDHWHVPTKPSPEPQEPAIQEERPELPPRPEVAGGFENWWNTEFGAPVNQQQEMVRSTAYQAWIACQSREGAQHAKWVAQQAVKLYEAGVHIAIGKITNIRADALEAELAALRASTTKSDDKPEYETPPWQDHIYDYTNPKTNAMLCAERGYNVKVDGTFDCPICGSNEIHDHSSEEIAAHRSKPKPSPTPGTEPAGQDSALETIARLEGEKR